MKLFKSIILALAIAVAAISADAGSIGRSSSSSSSSHSSFSSSSSASRSSSFSAPAPSKPSGIGGTASMGVSKPSVTQPLRPSTPTPTYGTAPTPSYGGSPSYGGGYSAPAPAVVHHDPFMSSLTGSMVGSMLGNAMSRPSTTVVAGGGGVVQSGGPVYVDGNGGQVQPVVVQRDSGYGIGHFIIDVLLFGVLLAVIVGLGLLLYKGTKMLKSYANTERGIDENPFAPTERFWTIQKAFGLADKQTLMTLLGPDLRDEILQDITPCELDIAKVSHEVRLLNNREFSVLYKFEDEGTFVAQVWHYEKHDGDWKLNGIETI
jgi:hypothetical protein